MHVDLLATTKGSPKIIHGTENGKKTACGINLVKPENIGMFTNAGQMNDVIQLTCEKCKTVIAKKLIRESNKEMAAQLKEEQRQLKRERSASKHRHDAPAAPSPVQSAAPSDNSPSGGYIPPSMRKAMQAPQEPIVTPPPAPHIPTPMPAPVPPAPQPVQSANSQFAVPPVPTQAPIANSAEDVLAQFAVPSVPSSLPQSAPVVPQIPQAAPVIDSAEDVLAQFAVPSVPSVPTAPAPAPIANSAEDVLAQFAVPSVPTVPTAPAPAPIANSAEDVLAQFAVPSVPTVPPAPAPAPIVDSAEDVLAQFAVPSVPTVPPAPAPAPIVDSAEDVLAQFAVPSVPTVPTAPSPAPIVDSAEDVLAQFAVPSAPAAPSVPDIPTLSEVGNSAHVSGSSVNQNDILAQFALKQPGTHPYPADDAIPSAPAVSEDPLADLLLMPKGQEQSGNTDILPDIANVPSSIPAAQTVPTAIPQAAFPSLNVPQAPPAPPVPEMPVPPVQQAFAVPTLPPTGYPVPPVQGYPQGFGQVPPQGAYPLPNNGYPTQQFNPFAVPTAPKQSQPETPTPLFVGYSADGRQLFQTYDALGNPIPINEPVYSAPPEQKDHNIAAQVAAMAANTAMHGNAPVMDMDEIMAKMGIEDPKKRKKEEGKAINFTEYKIPEKKKKKPASARPAAAVANPVPEGPVSAAEAKRRKKVDKINKEFEKQLRSRGIDPKTGGIMIDNKK